MEKLEHYRGLVRKASSERVSERVIEIVAYVKKLAYEGKERVSISFSNSEFAHECIAKVITAYEEFPMELNFSDKKNKLIIDWSDEKTSKNDGKGYNRVLETLRNNKQE